MKKQAICVALMVLLSVGVIATLLAVLLTDTSGTNEDNEVEVSGEPGGEPMEGEYVYAESNCFLFYKISAVLRTTFFVHKLLKSHFISLVSFCNADNEFVVQLNLVS